MLKKNIIVPIFSRKMKVIVVDKISDMAGTKYDPKSTGQINAFAGRWQSEEFGYMYVLAIEKSSAIPVIVHECIHIANMMLEDIGVIADFGNDETQAYLTEWIFKEVFDFAKRNVNKCLDTST